MPAQHLTRRNLLHWYMPSATHFVTFRLAGSLPRAVLDELRDHKACLLKRRRPGQTEVEHRELVHKKLFAMYDDCLMKHQDVHWLNDHRVAALVRRSLYFLNNQKYGLLAYSIMSNHVHLLIRPFDFDPSSQADWERLEPGETADVLSPLAKIMHSLKSYTAHEANKLLRRKGSFWQHESYDHWVRDDAELERIVAYINANAVKAGLAKYAYEYPWCSAHDRWLHDGATSGWLVHS